MKEEQEKLFENLRGGQMDWGDFGFGEDEAISGAQKGSIGQAVEKDDLDGELSHFLGILSDRFNGA
jgi:hypothetical protein